MCPNSCSSESSSALRLALTASLPSSTWSHRCSAKYSAEIIWLSMLVPPSVFHGMSRSRIECGAMKKPRRKPGPRIFEKEPMYIASPGSASV